MNITEYQQIATVQYCFPDNNSSCRKEVQTGTGNIFLFTLLSCISVCTVCLNLLVIISISHFKQLHSPTNLLVLSLAVADLLVGLIVMPVKIMELIDNCWYFGEIACTIVLVINSLSLSTSLCSMVFIAVDRYIAVNDPLIYSTKITVCKTSLIIILGWSFSLLYVIIYLHFNDSLLQSQIGSRCLGECILFVIHLWVIIDLVVFFIAPCCTILVLYSFIFNVARFQAKAVRAVLNSTSSKHGDNVSNSSEIKAAKTLGIVVCVYLACWIPFYLSSLSSDNISTLSLVWTMLGWLAYMNSSVNPLIYAIFYPWFKASTKYIVTCKIFESSSSRYNLFREHF
ncbi:trace amine-associated receptor 13c-like [Electrophorus electricus]|uniref:trace amine-associated receptor 13c-like n=1 Tax=Electrophorus electricus TaxID=8005 RepID=UPI000F0A4620|nr:trace amine-associated receptor 13c-like [Electrophorus electricus]